MPTFKVSLGPNFIMCAANDEEHAKDRSISLFSLKYPEIKQIDTDELVVEEAQ